MEGKGVMGGEATQCIDRDALNVEAKFSCASSRLHISKPYGIGNTRLTCAALRRARIKHGR